jgi:hypothetical protein
VGAYVFLVVAAAILLVAPVAVVPRVVVAAHLALLRSGSADVVEAARVAARAAAVLELAAVLGTRAARQGRGQGDGKTQRERERERDKSKRRKRAPKRRMAAKTAREIRVREPTTKQVQRTCERIGACAEPS